LLDPRSKRSKLEARVSEAFAPATISNFFTIHTEGADRRDYKSFAKVGATGGGFILRSGVFTKARFIETRSRIKVEIFLDGDPGYKAKTTIKAVQLLLGDAGVHNGSLRLEQRVEVPIGRGFGASAASALSAVMAVSSAMGLKLSQTRVAYAAHVAEILRQTGLGTVSVIYKATGAGAITKAGAPGVSRFLRVKVPKGTVIVAASLAPFVKRDILSSNSMKRKVNDLGKISLAKFMHKPTLETLAESGEWFATELGMESEQVRSLIQIAKRCGALWASQNMVGHSIHSLVDEKEAQRVASALAESGSRPAVGIYEIGEERARVLLKQT